MSFIIRQIARGDAEALVLFYNALSEASKRTFHPLDTTATVKQGRDIIEDNAPEMAKKYDLVALDGERIVGWSFLWSIESGIPTLGLGVADACHSRGVGRALMDRILFDARQRGIKQITLTVVEDNERALRMYGRRGFVRHEAFTGEDGLPYYRMSVHLARVVDRPEG